MGGCERDVVGALDIQKRGGGEGKERALDVRKIEIGDTEEKVKENRSFRPLRGDWGTGSE